MHGFERAARTVPRWAIALAVVAALVASPLVVDFDRRWRRVTVMLFVVSVAGVYFTVPDTEFARVLLGSTAVVAIVGLLVGGDGLGAAGAVACVCLLSAVVAFDGRGRPGSVVGGLACLGMLVVEPAARRLARGAAMPLAGVVVGHLALIFVAARVAGRRHDALAAAVVIVPILVVATGVSALWARARPVS